MAEEHGGQQSTSWPWLKLFTAFKIAVLPSKLFLAAVGILAMALGWNVLGWIFFAIRSEPKASDYKDDWKGFQQAQRSWNLFYEMAGNESRPEQAEDVVYKIASYKQFVAIKNATELIKFKIHAGDDDSTMEVGGTAYPFRADKAVLENLKSRDYYGRQISILDADKGKVAVAGNFIELTKVKLVSTLQEFVDSLKDMDQASVAIADDLINHPTYKRLRLPSLLAVVGISRSQPVFGAHGTRLSARVRQRLFHDPDTGLARTVGQVLLTDLLLPRSAHNIRHSFLSLPDHFVDAGRVGILRRHDRAASPWSRRRGRMKKSA